MKIFLFFTFYYNVITNNPKKYEIAMGGDGNKFLIIFTPLLLLIITFVLTATILPIKFSLLCILWIPIATGNVIFYNNTSMEAYRIRREEIYKREKEIEKKLREALRREENLRRERESERFRREREKFRNQYKEYQQQINLQENERKNINNAMNLLGLNKGFTIKDVKKSYRRLSKIHHPDMGGTQNNFIRLTKAYNYLMNRSD